MRDCGRKPNFHAKPHGRVVAAAGRREKARRMQADGMSTREIAAALGVTTRSVTRYLNPDDSNNNPAVVRELQRRYLANPENREKARSRGRRWRRANRERWNAYKRDLRARGGSG